jgi:hypothetical protein
LRLSSQVAQEHHHPLNIWLLLVAVEVARAVVVAAVIELAQVMQLQQAYQFQSL